jgi:hypothetical protein
MEEHIQALRDRHEKEIKDYQKSCQHDRVSDWTQFMWAPGHFGSDVKFCLRCDKIIEQRKGE